MEPLLPFPVSPISNGEWCPLPITDIQRRTARRIVEETARRAKRLGMTRVEFLRTAAGTATAFLVLNEVFGRDAWGDAAALPVRREHCDDPAAGRELLDQPYFVMDVQTHHVDLRLPNPEQFCGLRYFEPQLSCADRTQHLGQLNYVKEVFLDSETTVAVVSGVPGGILMGPKAMAETRKLVNRLAGSERALSQAICDPTFAPKSATSIRSLRHQVRKLKAQALKCYTYSGAGWWLDSDVGSRMLEKAQRLGIRLVNVHKGLPNQLVPHSEEYVRTTDIPGAVRNFPELRFCVYHAGYFLDARENFEFLSLVDAMPADERARVYADVGSSFAINLLAGPTRLAHFMGRLLKTCGPKNILWGTDSIWWGSPQFLIDAMKTLQIPADLQAAFGYPPISDADRRDILGLNAARLYGVDPDARRCTVAQDRLSMAQAAQGGHRAGRTFRTYGARTRREFLAMWRREQVATG